MELHPTILIDTREQCPWSFHELPSETATLDTGDYSVKGLSHLVSVERKSIQDLVGCVGADRDRFKRELQRLRAYRFALVVVEADAATLEQGNWRGKLQPAHVLGSLAAWIAQYNMPIWIGGDHDMAGRFVERYLYQCAREVARGWEAAVGAKT